MSFLDTLQIASSGMTVARTRMNVAAMNMANKNTTRTPEGGPYKRRDVIVETVPTQHSFGSTLQSSLDRTGRGREAPLAVRVADIEVADDDPILVYDPGHPDADQDGNVGMPAVSGLKQMVNMMGAARAYEAGINVLQTVKQMAEQAMRIGR